MRVRLHPSLHPTPSCELSCVPPQRGAAPRVELTSAALGTFSHNLHTRHVRCLCCAESSRASPPGLGSALYVFWRNWFESIRSREGHRAGKDDGSGAAAIRDDIRGRRGHVARAALRQQAALWTAARAGSGAHHQEEQVQTREERLAVALTNKYGKRLDEYMYIVKLRS